MSSIGQLLVDAHPSHPLLSVLPATNASQPQRGDLLTLSPGDAENEEVVYVVSTRTVQRHWVVHVVRGHGSSAPAWHKALSPIDRMS